MSNIFSRARALTAVGLLGSAAILSAPAPARANGGVFIGIAPVPLFAPPVVYPPAYYSYPYYPPVAYTPPPGYYPPPAQTPAPKATDSKPVAYGSMCRAGIYSCAAAPYTPVGGTCACPAIGAPSYGTAY
jgi:hypothetical protein